MSEQTRHAGNGSVYSDDPAVIERDLESTRRHLAGTIDALSGRASASYISDQAMGYLRDAGGLPRDYVRNLSDTIRYHPVPVTLLGVSLAWLMAAGSRSVPWHPTETSSMGASTGTTGKLKQRYQHAKESAQRQAHGVKERVRGMGESISSSREEVGERAELARIRAQRRREEMGQQAGQFTDSISRAYHEQPLFIGLLGLAVGGLAGALMPQRPEGSEELRERALAAARDPFEKMAEKGREAVEAAGEKVREGVAEAGRESQEKVEHPPSPDIH